MSLTEAPAPTTGGHAAGISSPATAELSRRLEDPAVAHALASLLDHADLLAMLVQGLDQMVARSEVIGDSLVSGIAELRGAAEGAAGSTEVDPAAVLHALVALAGVLPKAAPGMVGAVESGAIDRLLASDLVSAAAVDQVGLVATGLVRGAADYAAQPVQITGLMSAARLLKDPDINRTLSYFATVARAIGRELAASSSRA